MKVPVSTRLETEVVERIERLAKVDRRSVANVLEVLVLRELPRLEGEILHSAPTFLNDAPTLPVHASRLQRKL